VPLDPLVVTDLNVALDESTVEGIRWDERSAEVHVALRVLSLRPDGEPDDDCLRVLTCAPAADLRILLRRDRFGTIPYGPPIPLPDQQALAEFVRSVGLRDSMYGGRAIDDASPLDDWPATVSLDLTFGGAAARHCLYWFTDCSREEPGGTVGYRLEGLVRFGELSVRREDGTAVDVRRFADDGLRWWAARLDNDPRVSSRARRTLSGLDWPH
jgi:hypothetical protein